MRIVVIGGTGLIGSKVVTMLGEHGHEAVAASPNTGVNTAAATLAGYISTEQFAWGLHRVLDGLTPLTAQGRRVRTAVPAP